MRTFIRKLDKDGTEVLGTLDTIFLDGRRSRARHIADADYHASARKWPGYVMYTCSHLREPWTEIHRVRTGA
jgi:hypothetical protein